MKMITKILTLLLLFNIGLYANAVGTITALSGNASILRGSDSITATLGAKLEQKDTIKTADATKVQVIFSDDTIISIGKNSNFSIDEFLFDDSDTPSAKFGLLSGAMRTITGKIGKVAPDKFSVKTKTATIGIRGTNFSIFAQPDGSAKVFCTFGAISVAAGGDASLVSQGFFVQVSPDGARSEPIKFTPKELKEQQEESLGTSSDAQDSQTQDSGSESELASLETDSMVDTSSNDNLGLVVTDITETASDSVQTQEVQKVEKIITDEKEEQEKQPDPTPPPNPTPTPPEPTPPTTYTLQGYAHNKLDSENTAAQVNFSVTGGVFFGASIVESINSDAWTYTISTTPTSFTSLDSFETKIVGISTTDSSATNISLKESGNFFRATSDDLQAGDSMSWGEWGVSMTHDTSSGDYTKEGLWIAGEATKNSVIDGYRDTALYATYSGKYKATSFNNGIFAINGDATLKVDFGHDSVYLHIAADSTEKLMAQSIQGTIINDTQNGLHNQFKVSGTPYAGNYFDGRFYGADGKSAGGIFTIMDNTQVSAKGVYQVKTTEFHNGVHPDISNP